MISHEDLVRIPMDDVRKALAHGERSPEPGHGNPMTGVLRSAGRWILEHTFQLDRTAEPLILRLKTTQVLGKMLYVPIGFMRNGRKIVVAMYVHMPGSRLATVDSIRGITVAGWAKASDLRTLHTPGTDMVCVANNSVLNPMATLDVAGKDDEE